MIRITTAALFAAALAVTGCASAPQQPAADPNLLDTVKISHGVADIAKEEGKVDLEKDKRVNCERYKPTGSNRTQYRCSTVAESEKSKQKAQEQMQDLTKPAPTGSGSGIGN